MAASPPSQLDFSQCIQGAYDDAQGRLRVEGQATIVNGAIEVSINATDDNIAIKDPSNGNVLKINSNGSINVDGSAHIQPVSGTFFQATQPVSIASTVAISAASLPLPSGAATNTLQTTGNTSLFSIDSKTPLLGQALNAASVPVVLTASQLSTLTPLSTIVVTQSTGTSLHTVIDSGTITLGAGSASIGSVSSVIKDPTTGTGATVSLSGALSTTSPPPFVFNDPFNGTVIDTTNRWSNVVLAGTATLTQNGSTGLTFAVGTTANNAVQINSQPSFDISGVIDYILGVGVKLETTTMATGAYRFWGYGTQGSSYSTSDPILDGVGFDITTTGILRAVIYSADTLVFSQVLTPITDGAEHLYIIFILGNNILWFIDNVSIPVATSGLAVPNNTLLPLRFAEINGASTTVGTPIFDIFSLALLDENRNASQIADGTYPWRKAQISAAGAIKVDGSAVTQPVSIPTKVYMSGFTTAPTTTYSNILDTTTGANPTDVRNYYTATVTMLSSATTGSYIFEGAWVSDFATGGTVTLKVEEITATNGASLINAAITPTNTTRIFRINVSDINYLRCRLSVGYTSGILIANTNLTQQQVTPAQIAVVQGTGTNLHTVVDSGTVTTVTTVSSVTSSNSSIPGLITDVASAAITTTTTTATLTPTFGSSYQVNIPVTAVSGTTPTLDIELQESDDSGTNWKVIYDFPRITTTGFYRSPLLPLTGNRIKYVQTVSGTTPSFTRSINRLQSSMSVKPYRQLIDRTIAPNSLNSTTATNLIMDDATNVQILFDLAAVAVAPVIQLEGSDDLGNTWYAIGSGLTGVASSTVSMTINNINSALIRARISTAGTSATLNYVLIKVF